MGLNRLESILGTAGIVPASRRKPRRDIPPIPPDTGCEAATDESQRYAPVAFDQARSRSEPSLSAVCPFAWGKTRMTRLSPGMRRSTLSFMRCRSCLRIRLRTTAFPTVLGTTKPTEAEARSAVSAVSGDQKWSMRLCDLPRAPPLIVARKSPDVRIRLCAGSTSPRRLRQKALRGPCDGGRKGWRGQRGWPCACGSRAPWRAYGYWAGKSASP